MLWPLTSAAGRAHLSGWSALATAFGLLFLPGAPCLGGPRTHDDRALYTPQELSAIYSHSPLGPLPADPTNRFADDRRAAAFGRSLFFATRFSANHRISCATCHQPARAFTDGRALARGLALGTRNTPTVLDAALGRWYFLDGRADSLWSQALQPFENPREFGGDRLHIVLALSHDQDMRRAYIRVFGPLPRLSPKGAQAGHARPDANSGSPLARAWQAMAPDDRRAVDLAFSNLGKAIEAYERTLLTKPAPFDRYVAALKSGSVVGQRVISEAAKRGLKLFVGAASCELCHSGPTFSDGQFHNLGLPTERGMAPDPGRAEGIRRLRADPFNAAGAFSDAPAASAMRERLSFLPDPLSQLGAFKTPTLREISLTAPYMHDGRFGTLEQVVRFYTEHGSQAGHGRIVGQREETLDLIPPLTMAQRSDLVEFLRTLAAPVDQRTR